MTTFAKNAQLLQLVPTKDDTGNWFDCGICASAFAVYDEYRSHMFSHFTKKHCSKCNVQLIQMCDNEWYSLHTTSNCQHTKHIDDSNSTSSDYDDETLPSVVKEEPPLDIEADQLDNLLNEADADMHFFGEIFEAESSTDIETHDNDDFHATLMQQTNTNSEQSIQNAISNNKVVSTTENKRMINDPKRKPRRAIKFQCGFCFKQFDSQLRLDSHFQSRHIVENLTRCKYCNKKFNSFDQLDRHLRQCVWIFRKGYSGGHSHRPAVGPFTCDICGNVLKSFRSISYHILVKHLKKKSYKCRFCGQLCPSEYYLAKHSMIHKQAFEKFQGNSKKSNADSMERQVFNQIRTHPHRPKSNFICDICGVKMLKFDMVIWHMSIKHGAVDSFQSRLCGRIYPARHFLKEHMKRHKKVKKLGIPEDQLFGDIDEGLLARSYAQKARDRNKTITEAKPIESINSVHDSSHNKKNARGKKSNEQTHSHQPNTDFTCDTCGIMYKINEKLMKHMATNHSSKDSFMNKRHLNDSKDDRVHPQSIKEIVKHECSKCEKSFASRIVLLKHEEKHIGTSCEVCGKQFLFKEYLRKHMKIVHEKRRSFQCPVEECNVTFHYASCIRNHLAGKHGIFTNKNTCPICFEELSDGTYLKNHLKTHANNTAKGKIPEPYNIMTIHEKKRIQCEAAGCNERFSYRSCMKDHMVRKHGMARKQRMVKNRIACPICSKEFPGRICHLKRHLKTHEKMHNKWMKNQIQR